MSCENWSFLSLMVEWGTAWHLESSLLIPWWLCHHSWPWDSLPGLWLVREQLALEHQASWDSFHRRIAWDRSAFLLSDKRNSFACTNSSCSCIPSFRMVSRVLSSRLHELWQRAQCHRSSSPCTGRYSCHILEHFEGRRSTSSCIDLWNKYTSFCPQQARLRHLPGQHWQTALPRTDSGSGISALPVGSCWRVCRYTHLWGLGSSNRVVRRRQIAEMLEASVPCPLVWLYHLWPDQ